MNSTLKNLEAQIKYLQLVSEGKRTFEQFEDLFKPKTIKVNYKKYFSYKCNLQ